MTAANEPAYDTDFLDTLSQRVVVGDGAMGSTQLHAADLSLDGFNDLEGCNEILNETRPDVIEQIHCNYFEAGADAVETNWASSRRSGDDVDSFGREALQRLFGGARSLLVSATLGRVKDAFRYGRNLREVP